MSRGVGERVRSSRLGRLDDRVVPRLQRRARSLVQGTGAPFLATHRLERRLLGGAPYRFAWRRRRLLRSLVVVLALLGSVVHFQRYPDLLEAREAERAAARQQTIRQPDLSVSAPEGSGAVAHGPPLEGRPSRYVEQRQAALAGLEDGNHVAIVSFTGYLATADVLAVLPDPSRVLSAQYRIPDANARALETEVVGGDLSSSLGRVIDDEVALIEDEEAALRELLESGTLGDPAFEADARARLEELRTVRNVLRATGAIVFAVVIEADADDLRTLQQVDPVRLVDPLPDDVDVEGSILFGLRPEDRSRITFGVAG